MVWEVDVGGHLNSLARTVGRVVTCMWNFWNWNASRTVVFTKSVVSLIQLTYTQCVGDAPGFVSHRAVAGEDKANTYVYISDGNYRQLVNALGCTEMLDSWMFH